MDLTKDLTKRQQEIFDFIRKYSAKYGYPPTVQGHRQSRRAGLLLDGPRAPREPRRSSDCCAATRPSRARSSCSNGRSAARSKASGGWCAPKGCRCSARCAAGQPMLAEENIEDYVDDPRHGRRRRRATYLLRIRGESMKDAGILEGDHVVVHSQDTARDGDIVVALLGEEATVKRFFREPDHIRLQPENETMEPIRSKEVKVLGKVVGLLRKV